MSESSGSESGSQVVDSEETLLARGETVLADWRVRREKTAYLLGTARLAGTDGSCPLLGL